nr:GNAT family N-acetyltransferase [Bacteriovorax sp. HI3]
MDKIKKDDISVRRFLFEDITPLVDYWTKSSAEYWRERGLDKSKLSSEKEFTEYYENSFKTSGGVRTIAVILFRGKPIGVHTLTDFIENESAIFHAHIWSDEYRKKGIGFYSYPAAIEFFMDTLSLKKVIFKTPLINAGANKVKEKLGIPCLGETVFESPVLIGPLEANLYEVDRELLQKIKQRIA